MKERFNWLIASRRRVLLIALGILLILDLGRSAYARVGYASPAEPWQEAPYQSIEWPPGQRPAGSGDLPTTMTQGEQIYRERCAICHGPDGRGDGAAAASMIPRPRDFTMGFYKYKSTPDGQPPTGEDLINVVANGLHASAMPYFGDILTEDEIAAVVEHLKSLAATFDGPAPEAFDIPARVTPNDASITRGAALFTGQACYTCHGDDGRGGLKFTDRKGYPVVTRDLTAPWTFRGGSEPEDLYRRITTGLAPSPMPAFADNMTPEERWDLVNYVLSLARTPPWEAGGVLDGPGFQDDLVKRGEYLVHAEMCGLCHTQVDTTMIYSGDDYYLAGGMGIPAYPQGIFVSRNLTSDPETGLGNWTLEEIAAAIRDGKGRDRYMNFWGMPWMMLHSFEQEDALAIAAYLKSLPPVKNKIPLPLKYGFVETTIGKITHSSGVPPLGDPDTLIYKAGNYGQTDPGFLPRDWPQRVLIGLQWLILAGGVVAFVVAAPPEKRVPRGFRGWAKTGFGLIGLFFSGFLVWVIYSTPVLPFVPPAIINDAVTAGIPSPDPAGFDSPEDAALAARGEYLYIVTSCSYCHGDGRGGQKVNAPAFGTLWVKNITPDAETGIGNWTGAEIARAIRSGVSKNGTQLHWQGMIWDHLGNLDEEDIRALVIYMKAMPPVVNAVPDQVPPSPNDCDEYSFFLIESFTPGCKP
ncbi:MAG: c-type cytochrome [Anaerolineales bacterium]